MNAVAEHDMAVQGVDHADAADVEHAEEAGLLNAGHDEADLVHVSGQHHALAGAVALLGADQIAHGVHFHSINIRRDDLLDHVDNLVFTAGGAVSVQNALQSFSHRLNPPLQNAPPAIRKASTRRYCASISANAATQDGE